MRARLRAFDWAATPLGPIARWPQSLKTAVDLALSSPVSIVMLWGPEGTLIYNDGYSVFAGGRHPALLGAPVLEGWPEVADFNRRVMDVCLRGGTLSFRDEPLVLHRHGVPEQVWLDLNYSPIRDETGRPAGVFAIVVETTERVLAERQVRALNARLEAQVDELAALDRAKTAFFSNISHEFRTPLTLMLGPTEDALASPSRTLGGADLEMLHRNELRLLTLVNALLDFSRIEAGRMRATFAPTDVARATRELASGFDSAIARAGLRYDVDVEPIGEAIYLDREMWETVVLNLLSNALKFTFQGAIGVALRDRGDRVELSVRDTGIGIAAGELPRLFERFHRIEGARARTEEGSGIGLALVHDLVTLHGGRVTAESVPGAGTTFRVTLLKGSAHLPADRVQDTAAAPGPSTRLPQYTAEAMRWLSADTPLRAVPAAAGETRPAHGTTTRSGRVLVADDNADMRDYLTRVLGTYWTVEAVSDGAAALAAATREPPDVILSDVMMAGLDGFALLRALRAGSGTRHIPVIILSARAGEEARVEGLHVGADDYLVKPFSARELVARVNSQMALAHHRRERAELLEREQAARTEAERQKQHLHSLLMQAPLPIAILRGPDYVFELVNEQACRIWAKTYEQMIGRPLVEALPEVNDPALPFLGLLADVRRTGTPYIANELPAHVAAPDGSRSTIYLTFIYAPLRSLAGEIDGVFVLGADVTAQVQARQLIELTQSRLTFALDAAGVGYWDLDLTTHAAMRSPSHDQIFGYPSPLPEWTFEMFVDHVAAEDRARVRASFERAAASGEDWRFDCRIVRRDGEARWIAAHGRSERGADGRPVRMLGVVIDITERRELLEQAQQARAEADRASRAKDEFMAMLGHELRNPLSPIQTALHIMRQRGDPAARERTVIQRQVDHLTRLVDDLLDVSRIARGKVELRRARLEVAEAVATALETAGPLVEERGHTLDVDVATRGLAVEGDLVRLAQVIANLLTNAAKYTEPGGRISVRAGREDGEVVLRVRDTGIGLSADMLPRVFDLFAQAPQTLDRSHGGLGLGLSIVRSLIAQHGGTVTAHSEGRGMGSEFVVRLPAAPAAAGAPAAHPAQDPAPRAAGSLDVLVVDDNRDAAEMLAEALALQGHVARVAHDGPQALRLCETFRPAVALLDLGLPVMDGYELAGRLRRLPDLDRLRIVAVSGYGQESDKERSRAAGFDAHLVKPIDLDQLARTLAP